MVPTDPSRSQTVQFMVHSGELQLTLQGIVDTGATHSYLSKRVAEALNLTPVGTTRVQSVGGITEVSQSFIDITYKESKISQLLVVIGDAPFDFLAGLDVIARLPSVLFDAFPNISEATPLPANVVKGIFEDTFQRYEQKRSGDYIRDVLFGDLFVGGVIGGILSYLLITLGSFLFGLAGFAGAIAYVIVLMIVFSWVLVRRSRRPPRITS